MCTLFASQRHNRCSGRRLPAIADAELQKRAARNPTDGRLFAIAPFSAEFLSRGVRRRAMSPYSFWGASMSNSPQLKASNRTPCLRRRRVANFGAPPARMDTIHRRRFRAASHHNSDSSRPIGQIQSTAGPGPSRNQNLGRPEPFIWRYLALFYYVIQAVARPLGKLSSPSMDSDFYHGTARSDFLGSFSV